MEILPTNQWECDTPCIGNKKEICGSSWRMNLYLTKVISDNEISTTTEITETVTKEATTAWAKFKETTTAEDSVPEDITIAAITTGPLTTESTIPKKVLISGKMMTMFITRRGVGG